MLTFVFLLSLPKNIPNFRGHSVSTSLIRVLCSFIQDKIEFICSFQMSALAYALLLLVACKSVMPLPNASLKNLGVLLTLLETCCCCVKRFSLTCWLLTNNVVWSLLLSQQTDNQLPDKRFPRIASLQPPTANHWRIISPTVNSHTWPTSAVLVQMFIKSYELIKLSCLMLLLNIWVNHTYTHTLYICIYIFISLYIADPWT